MENLLSIKTFGAMDDSASYQQNDVRRVDKELISIR
jgi:hypothetical protein